MAEPFGSETVKEAKSVMSGAALYAPEFWTVQKNHIYAAINALETALSYMPHIKTDVPQWQKTLEQDIVRMQCAITQLRAEPNDSSR